MATWTEELKKQAIDTYMAGGPTEENSVELVKEIADDLEMSANGVRQVLSQAKVYVKKGAATTTTKSGAKGTGDKAPRVSKESQIAELKELIESKGKEADDEILSKLTGKLASYLVSVFS
jgi:transposase-like protein